MAAPKFELYKDKSGDFRWRLLAANGETIASGQGYTTKAKAQEGIDSVKENARKAIVEDKTA